MEKRIIYGIGILIGMIVLLAAYTLFFGHSGNFSKLDNVLVPQSMLQSIMPNESISNLIGIGGAINFPTKGSYVSMKINGKPWILYVGGNFCPFCASERWGMVIALSRFGSFSNLHYMTSSASDQPAGIATFTFYNSSYQSSYVAFSPVEMNENFLAGGGYKPLQRLNDSQLSIASSYVPGGQIPFPFIDVANFSITLGANFVPTSQNIVGKNWTQIAKELKDPNSETARDIIGTANLLTEEICRATNNTPANVCTQQYVKDIRNAGI